MKKVTCPDGNVVQFGYDGLSRRVWRQERVSLRYFFYDGDKIIAEREGSVWVVHYLLGFRPVGFVSGGTLKVYHADRLGSVRWVADGSQSILVSYVYEGFGKIVGQNGGGGGPYQFCGLWGYRNDWDAGLLHVGARYYEYETGRWVQKDPELGKIYLPQTLHLYVYTVNIPQNLVDFKGKQIATFIELMEGEIKISNNEAANNIYGGVMDVVEGAGWIMVGSTAISVGATIVAGGGPPGWLIGGVIIGGGAIVIGSYYVYRGFKKVMAWVNAIPL